MLKQTQMNRPLYDKVRQDLFEEKKKTSLRIPSITTICLLQVQAFIVQMLSNLPSISDERPCSMYQYAIFCSRSMTKWILLSVLFMLDNIARLLNVESELKEMIIEDDDEYCSQKTATNDQQCTNNNNTTITTATMSKPNNNNTNQSGTSEGTIPNKRSNGHSMVSPSSPIHSPTPNFVLYPTRPINSPVLGPSRVKPTNRIRSSSFNNTYDKQPKQQQQQQQQQLRRSPGRREITVHNATLPISRKLTQDKKQTDSTANSITSRSSSSETSTTKPRMKKTMSLTTAQQYHDVR
ncbi:hypothetical protein BD770DRAFT_102351 [Pilaira anomala]|nr:hypothetical protein BD770DRAFT_102351 [Pilaira anomala]